jgi:hypothetical protein
MSLYMYQFAYTPESWAAQLKKPENRVENVGRALCEAAGGKLIGAWPSRPGPGPPSGWLHQNISRASLVDRPTRRA